VLSSYTTVAVDGVNASFVILISRLTGFCKTYFCFQGAIPEIYFAKKLFPAVSFANRSFVLQLTPIDYSKARDKKNEKLQIINAKKMKIFNCKPELQFLIYYL